MVKKGSLARVVLLLLLLLLSKDDEESREWQAHLKGGGGQAILQFLLRKERPNLGCLKDFLCGLYFVSNFLINFEVLFTFMLSIYPMLNNALLENQT